MFIARRALGPAVLAWILLLARPSYSTPEWTWLQATYGDLHLGKHGSAVAWIGDIDGDSHDDFVVGQPAGDCIGCDPGAATVYSGSTGRVLYKLTAGVPMDEFGLSLVGLGDVDGDRTPDFAVAAPEREIGGPGRVFIYSGKTGAVLRVLTGQGGGFGTSMAVVGDVDGDGIPDLIIGAPYLESLTGAAYAVSPATGDLLQTYEGTQSMSRFGQSVAGCGDLDGDHVADPLVAVPNQVYGSLNALSGAAGSSLYEVDSLQYWFNPVVQAIVDIDGDGVRDFALGQPGGVAPSSYVDVYSAATGHPLLHVEGPAYDKFGTSVCGGFVTGQAAPDLIVGAPDQGFIGAINVFWTATAALEFSVYGETRGSRFGSSAAVGGDVNGDGRPDLLVGAPMTTHADLVLGAAYVFAWVDRAPSRAFLDGGATDVHLGGGGPEVCFRLEPQADYLADDVVTSSIVLRATGLYRETHAIATSSGTVEDSDQLYVPETRACFSRQDLQSLLGDMSAGVHQIPISLEANLTDGRRVTGPMLLNVVVPAALEPSVSPIPMASRGSLTFRTSAPGVVRVALFDARGRHLLDLMPSSQIPEGYHTIALDGRAASGQRLPGGVYYYRIESPDGTATGKIVLLR